jgi:hypothetical protein
MDYTLKPFGGRPEGACQNLEGRRKNQCVVNPDITAAQRALMVTARDVLLFKLIFCHSSATFAHFQSSQSRACEA